VTIVVCAGGCFLFFFWVFWFLVVRFWGGWGFCVLGVLLFFRVRDSANILFMELCCPSDGDSFCIYSPRISDGFPPRF